MHLIREKTARSACSSGRKPAGSPRLPRSRTGIEAGRFAFQAFAFILVTVICPLTGISNELRTPDKSYAHYLGNEQYRQEQFKKAVSLIKTSRYKESEKILMEFANLPIRQGGQVNQLPAAPEAAGAGQDANRPLGESGLRQAGDDLLQVQANFLLGRLYREHGLLDKAERSLTEVVGKDFLLKDYALMTLADIYMDMKQFDKALVAGRLIQDKSLLREAKRTEINALTALKRDADTLEALNQYLKDYPADWDYKLMLARLFKNEGKKESAVSMLKEIYINATPLSSEALKELTSMKAAKFSEKENIERAGKFFGTGRYKEAENAYIKILKGMKESPEKNGIRFLLAMSQFKWKKYRTAVKSFDRVSGDEAIYWKARALFRINEMDSVRDVIKDFERDYPKSDYLAQILLLLADDRRREGSPDEAEEIFKKVLNSFPAKAEESLWGLGWINYKNKNYREASEYFSKIDLTAKKDSSAKYLFWKLKSCEMLASLPSLDSSWREGLAGNSSSGRLEAETQGACFKKGDESYDGLPEDTSYYGFLLRERFNKGGLHINIETFAPPVPEGFVYKKIEMLRFLGMDKEAMDEIRQVLSAGPLHPPRQDESRLGSEASGQALNNGITKQEFRYLAYTAIDLGEYKRIISFVENSKNPALFPLAYPLGYKDIVEGAAKKAMIDPSLVTAIIREESRFDPSAVSRAGARGLMQLMPATARRIKREVNIRLKNNSDIHNVEKNLLMGSHYLSSLISEFKDLPLAIAAYNAGENAVRKWVIKTNYNDIDEFIEDIPYRETRGYVKNVLRSYWMYKALDGSPETGISYREPDAGGLITAN